MMSLDRIKMLKALFTPHGVVVFELVLSALICFVISTVPVSAVIRFQQRSLMIDSTVPGATTNYTLSMEYVTQASVGSLNLLFCIDPIPYEPCVPPAGLDVSHAVLSSQSGESGYTITTQTANHLVLSRTPSVVVPNVQSSYVLSGVVNPTYIVHSFAIRLSDYATQDTSGPLYDQGAVITQITDSIVLQAQVPPILIFCVGKQVDQDCSNVGGGNYNDLGTLNPTQTLVDDSQMAAGTNASGGYVITVNGPTMSSGLNTINSPNAPSPSIPGTNEFGINLVANNNPVVGSDPDGASVNASVAANYGIPNRYMYHDGDLVASAPNVSLIRRYTVSYILNSSKDLRAGVYTTTLTYVCTGRF